MENLNELCEHLIQIKTEETEAKRKRITAEQVLLGAISDSTKLEGSSTINTDLYKIKTTAKLSYKLDYEAYQGLHLLPQDEFVDLKPTINLKKYRTIDEDITSECVTIKPQKTAVTIEEIG